MTNEIVVHHDNGRVIDVLDNGNLVIEGRLTLAFGENIKVIASGVVSYC